MDPETVPRTSAGWRPVTARAHGRKTPDADTGLRTSPIQTAHPNRIRAGTSVGSVPQLFPSMGKTVVAVGGQRCSVCPAKNLALRRRGAAPPEWRSRQEAAETTPGCGPTRRARLRFMQALKARVVN